MFCQFCGCCGCAVLNDARCPACHSTLMTDEAPAFLPLDLGEPAPGEEDDGRREDWAVWPEDFDRCP